MIWNLTNIIWYQGKFVNKSGEIEISRIFVSWIITTWVIRTKLWLNNVDDINIFTNWVFLVEWHPPLEKVDITISDINLCVFKISTESNI